MIYFDNSATTKTRDSVAKFLAECSTDLYFNPSGLYSQCIDVKTKLDTARAQLLNILAAPNDGQIIFTGSATEANNLVVKGLARKNRKIIVSLGEHPSVHEPAKYLQNNGYDVEFVRLNSQGCMDLGHLKSLITPNVGLVSFIHVANETGAVNNAKEIAKIVKQVAPTALVHCDGVQAFCKIPFEIRGSGVDLYTSSSHKIHGPKGVGALYANKNIKFNPQILGGGQEFGIRSGTENAPGILAFVMAAQIMKDNLEKNFEHAQSLKNRFIELLNQKCTDFTLNGEFAECAPNILSVSFMGIKGEVLLHLLEKRGVLVSTGSACSSKKVGNRVLREMGKTDREMEGNIRFSFSEFNTLKEVDTAVSFLAEELEKLRKIKI